MTSSLFAPYKELYEKRAVCWDLFFDDELNWMQTSSSCHLHQWDHLMRVYRLASLTPNSPVSIHSLLASLRFVLLRASPDLVQLLEASSFDLLLASSSFRWSFAIRRVHYVDSRFLTLLVHTFFCNLYHQLNRVWCAIRWSRWRVSRKMRIGSRRWDDLTVILLLMFLFHLLVHQEGASKKRIY